MTLTLIGRILAVAGLSLLFLAYSETACRMS